MARGVRPGPIISEVFDLRFTSHGPLTCLPLCGIHPLVPVGTRGVGHTKAQNEPREGRPSTVLGNGFFALG